MALKLNERYPGRYNNPSADYPQGSFKNRTTPTAKDGSYLEQDWANDKEGFFQSLLAMAVIEANGAVDKVGASQVFDALLQLGQIQAGVAFTTGGTATALTLTPTPAIQAYAVNQRFSVKFSVAAGLNPTLNVSAKGAKSLKQYGADGSKVAAAFAADQISDVVYDGTDFVVLDALATNAALGQCRLAKSGASIVLTPCNGNKLTINGLSQTVPNAGVSLSPAGLTPSTLYYIYAYMNAGVMTLEASATGHSTDTASGVEIKAGDATRTLVGMARPIAGPAWQDSVQQRFVLSWFNRRAIPVSGQFTTDRTVAANVTVEVNAEIRNEFLCWGDEYTKGCAQLEVLFSYAGTNRVGVELRFDGVRVPGSSVNIAPPLANADMLVSSSPQPQLLAEGYHFTSVWAQTNPIGTITFITINGSGTNASMLLTEIRG